ncbi:MAG: hypothetical protein ABJB66_04485 [Gemmatimonadaceae bacterium]
MTRASKRRARTATAAVSATGSNAVGTSAARVTNGSIISPVVDFLSVGGLSLLLLVPLLLSGRTDLVLIGAGAQAWIATAINMPHFMASYRLVYGSREMIRAHKWASIYVPLILILYMLAAIYESQSSRAMVIVLITVASVYLAWHYTGQVWGMMASFAYLDGLSFDLTERRLVRTSLRILLVWHLAWFLYTQLRDPSGVVLIYRIASGATIIAFVLGLIGLERMRRRTGRMPPRLAIVAWLAIFTWYAVMARDPKALFWVQIAHAMQYLIFPVRVELNSTASSGKRSTARVAAHMAAYGVVLLVVSVVVAQVVPASLMGIIGNTFGEEPGRAAPILILMFINIHHYFTDGVLWKISNPAVRKQLFAHVRQTSA